MYFDREVKNLATSDVTMVKRITLTKDYDYPEAIAKVALANDGMSATVTLFGKFVDKTKYIVSVKGFEDEEFTASLGVPTSMTISAKDAKDGVVLTTGNATPILVTYYDVKGVQVEPENPTVIFRLETRSTDGSYYLAGKELTIKKEGALVTVIAEYQGRVENGKRVGQLDTKETFTAMNQAPVVISGLAGATLTDWNNPSTTMRLNSGSKTLQVKFNKTDNKTYGPYTAGDTFDENKYRLSYTAINPDIAVVSNKGVVTAFKTGTASFYVNIEEKQSNGSWGTANPIAIVDVKVESKEKFSYTSIDNNGFITLGTDTTDKSFYTGEFKLAATDDYGNAWLIEGVDKVTLKCITDGYKEGDFASAVTVDRIEDKKAVIKVDAKAIYDILAGMEKAPKAGEATMLYFSATYSNYTVEFSVMVQVPGATDGNYIQVVASNDTIDALRVKEDNKTGVKKISFSVFEMNNAVKVGFLDYQTYPSAASAVSKGTYCYKITKDGKDLDAKFVGPVSAGKVEVTLSGVKDSNVIYDGVGAGTYVFELYQCYGEGEDAVLVQEYSSAVVVTLGEKGSYYEAGDLVNNKVENVTDLEILKCFNINARNNKPVIKDGALNKGEANFDDYAVTKHEAEGSGYVYVEKITFYEKVAEGEYVPYEVAVDTVLQIGK